ncbi:DUF4262 domain-containing protein [Synechococcus sp. WH 8016]|uniref:DUF4262 domain-containing protein n=1 Tax=Synechococcus sp. WH 8016 TaxID=166318 RepID=UPI00022DA154|nr:DUF4262 domain-containing protein [Synechococcus sp. WH 8016]EHA63732.1 hypothetical protein Syn8016DRAFT_0773 [Synechococcus sp. WH 8016]
MTTTNSSAPITPYEKERLATAKKHGFSFFMVRGDEEGPAFIYSIGMSQHGLPDVLMFLDSEYVAPQMGFLTNLLSHLIEGSKLFDADALIRSIHGSKKVVSDPEIEYTFTVLSPSDTDKAVHDYMCRCHYFRRVLGDPSVMVISSDFNPSWRDVTDKAIA